MTCIVAQCLLASVWYQLSHFNFKDEVPLYSQLQNACLILSYADYGMKLQEVWLYWINYKIVLKLREAMPLCFVWSEKYHKDKEHTYTYTYTYLQKYSVAKAATWADD